MIPILNGYELVEYEPQKIISTDWQWSLRGSSWCNTTCANCTMKEGRGESDGQYIRPIPKSAPDAKSMRCPNCGATKFNRVEIPALTLVTACCAICGLSGPAKITFTDALAAFSRIRMEPEPLVCPRCNQPTSTTKSEFVNAWRVICQNAHCGLTGSWAESKEQAEAEFRKLTYRKDSP